jgi:DnaJ-class molecular chaperone
LNPYEVLGVTEQATHEEIKAAFKASARRWHPDRNPAPEAAGRFKEAVAAWEILGEERARRTYDRYRAAPQRAEQQPEPGEPVAGEDIRVELDLDLAVALAGGPARVEYLCQAPCPSCDGQVGERLRCPGCAGHGVQEVMHFIFRSTIRCELCGGVGSIPNEPCGRCEDSGRIEEAVIRTIQVPRGSTAGTEVRLEGAGSGGLRGGPAGDLIVLLRVHGDADLRVEGRDLVVDLPLTLGEALVGARVIVETPFGRLRVQVPPGRAGGSRLRVPGKGLPGEPPGDLYLELELVPPPPGPEVAELAASLDALYPEHPRTKAGFTPSTG